MRWSDSTTLRRAGNGALQIAKELVSEQRELEIARVDAVFDVFRRSLCPPGSVVGTWLAVDLIIGYFFEACDVFDPNAKKRRAMLSLVNTFG